MARDPPCLSRREALTSLLSVLTSVHPGLHFVEATRRVRRGHVCRIPWEASAVSGMNVRDAFEQLLEEAMSGCWSSLFGSFPAVIFPGFFARNC